MCNRAPRHSRPVILCIVFGKCLVLSSISLPAVLSLCFREVPHTSEVPRDFFRGVQQIQLRAEDREDGDLGAVAPYSGVLEAAVIWYKKFHFI